MRALVLAIVVALLGAVVPPGATADGIPPLDGSMSFPPIQGLADPEEFSWEVQLDEDQELRSIDERHAGVYYVGDEMLAFTITATAAHAADGVTVPTTLAVTQPNIVTLTLHHRAGDPARGGASFVYPVSEGEGWSPGFATVTVDLTFEQPPPVTPPAPVPVRCEVPSLLGLTVKASRRQLRKAHCRLGQIRGERSRGARVAKQFRKPGKSLPTWSEVDVKLSQR